MLPYELYAHKQFCHNLGYALFVPDHNGHYDRVRVGDVGYFTKEGKFKRLFNAFHDADSPVNHGAHFPDRFRPIQECYRGLDTLASLGEGPFVSENVRVLRASGTAMLEGASLPLHFQGKIQFQCSSRTGAGLLARYPANQEQAVSARAMEHYLVNNCKSWSRLIRRMGIQEELHNLIFVTECVLTGDWATVVWETSSVHSEIDFNVGVSNGPRIGLSAWGAWQDIKSLPKRSGPRRVDSSRRRAYDMEQFDQCIFLRGLRVFLRQWYEKLVTMMQAKGEDEAGLEIDGSSPSVIRLLKNAGFRIELVGDKGSSTRPIQNGFELLAIIIFEKSDADIAIVEETDITGLHLHEADTLEGMCDILLGQEDIEAFTINKNLEDGNIVKVGKLSAAGTIPDVSSDQEEAYLILDEGFGPIRRRSGSDTSEGSFSPRRSVGASYKPRIPSTEDVAMSPPTTPELMRYMREGDQFMMSLLKGVRAQTSAPSGSEPDHGSASGKVEDKPDGKVADTSQQCDKGITSAELDPTQAASIMVLEETNEQDNTGTRDARTQERTVECNPSGHISAQPSDGPVRKKHYSSSRNRAIFDVFRAFAYSSPASSVESEPVRTPQAEHEPLPEEHDQETKEADKLVSPIVHGMELSSLDDEGTLHIRD